MYRDDLTGQVLDSKLVREARQKELDFFEAEEVWVKKRLEEAKKEQANLLFLSGGLTSTRGMMSTPTSDHAWLRVRSDSLVKRLYSRRHIGSVAHPIVIGFDGHCRQEEACPRVDIGAEDADISD